MAKSKSETAATPLGREIQDSLKKIRSWHRAKEFAERIRPLINKLEGREYDNQPSEFYKQYLIALFRLYVKEKENAGYLTAIFCAPDMYSDTTLKARREHFYETHTDAADATYAPWMLNQRDPKTISGRENELLARLGDDLVAALKEKNNHLGIADSLLFQEESSLLPEPTKEAPSVSNRLIYGLSGKNENFVGRAELLDDIEDSFENGKHIQILSGAAGVGKSQIAKQYAYENMDKYNVICWIDSENEESMKLSCAFVANGRDNIDFGMEFCKYINGLSGPWLIVYDNAEIYKPEQIKLLDRYTPKDMTNGHILITTRHKKDFHGIRPRVVGYFSDSEAQLFIQKVLNNVSRDDAALLAKRLSNHPLALSYAVSCIKETAGYEIRDYLEDLKKTGISIMEYENDGYPDGYRDTVHAAFLLTINKLLEQPENESEEDRVFRKGLEQIVNLLPYNPPNYINLEFLAEFGVMLPDELKTVVKNPALRRKLIRVLTSYSVCYEDARSLDSGFGTPKNSQVLSTHRLLQEIIADKLGEWGFYGIAIYYSTFWYWDGYAWCMDTLGGIIKDICGMHLPDDIFMDVKKMKQYLEQQEEFPWYETENIFNDVDFLREYARKNRTEIFSPNAFEDETVEHIVSRPFRESYRIYRKFAGLDYFKWYAGILSPLVANGKRSVVPAGGFTEEDINSFWSEVNGTRKFSIIGKFLGHGYLDGFPTYNTEDF